MATKKPSIKELTAKLQGVSSAAKSLGINTSKADAMVAQTERQGGKSFAGSREEKAYTKAQAEAGGVGVISSNQGKGLVKTADETMSRLAPAPIVTTDGTAVGTPTTPATGGTAGAPVTSTGATTEPKQKDTAGNFVTYYNEKTGQEQTLRGEAITAANKQALEQSGYTIASADTSTDTTETPEITALKTQVTTGQTAIDGFMKKLEASLVTDKELRGDIRTISQGYAARMDEARQITEQRKQTIQTLGARTGARYTGGMGGVLGSIISEEERQGLMRITEIENSKQEAIRNAKTEARNYNYNAYTKLMAQADKYQEQKVAELTALKAAQAEQDKVIAEEKKQSEYDALIGEQLAAGVTDPVELFKNLGGKVPFDMIGQVTKLMPKGPEDFTLSEGQARYDANGKLLASRAKTYAPTGAGSIDIPGSGILSDFPADIQNAAQSILDGKSKLNEYPSAKRLAINSAMSLIYKAEGGDQLAQDSYDAIVALETHPGFSDAIGAKGIASFYGLKDQPVGGSDAAGFIAKLNQFKANVKLVNIKYLKGTGALSDAEGKTLEDAGTSLDPSLPETDFMDELERVKKVLEKTSNIKIDYSNESNADLEAAMDAEIGGETDDVESDGLDANGYPL